MNNYFKSGQWNVICDVCGFKKKSGDIRKRWDGLFVCQEDWETDHPQKYLRVRESTQSVPFIRNEPTDVFIKVCTILTSQGVAGLGVVGCFVVGKDNVLPNQSI